MSKKQIVLELKAVFTMETSEDLESYSEAVKQIVEDARNYGAVSGTISFPAMEIEIV